MRNESEGRKRPDRTPARATKNITPPHDHEPTQSSADQTVVSGASVLGGIPVKHGPGSTIGNYRILGVLGEGGMGMVYEAEQQNPRRRVALKIIQGRHNTDEFHVRMFQREAALLGRLRHPNIAAIYESGHTDDGRHFFAMELARGETLDTFCRSLDDDSGFGEHTDSRADDPVVRRSAASAAPLTHADLEHRLRLFLKICDAVSYAHQRGVIHRDLKPSNIVVQDPSRAVHDSGAPEHTASHSGRGADVAGTSTATRGASLSSSTRSSQQPVVKILDFGLARISDPESEDATMLTQAGTVKGTPAYMSPEQAGGNPDETDLRADIYSLGVILYEMLSGVRPLDLSNVPMLEAVRIVREEEPVPLRRASVRTRRVEADLETVIHKALDKDCERRYQSVAELAMDIERFLNHEPVLAAPPSTTYKLRKLVRRHRTLFASLSAVAAVLIGATVVSTSLFVKAERESARARVETRKSEQVATFLTDMLRGVGPAVARGRDTQMLREILDTTAERVGAELADQPEVEATLRTVLGTTYRDLGEYAVAEPHLLAAADLWRGTFGTDDPRSLAATVEIAGLDYYQGRMAHAESLYTWAGDRLTATVGPEDPRTLTAGSGLILVYTYLGKLDEAATLGENIVPVLRRRQGDASEVTQSAMYHLAQTYTDQLRYAEAESLYLELTAILERERGRDHPFTLSARSAFAWLYRLDARYDEAEQLAEQALTDMRRILGDDHSETLVAVNNLAIIYKDQKKYAAAEPLYLESLESGIRTLGEQHPENLPGMVNLAAFYQSQERWIDAFHLADRAVTVFTDIMPEGHIGIAFALMTRGMCHFEQRQLTAAEADLLSAHDFMTRVFGSDHRHVRSVRDTLAAIYEQLGRTDDATKWRALAAAGEAG